MISVSYRSLLGRCKFIASVKRLRCTARLHKIDASRKQLRCTARLHKIDASRKQLRCTDRLQHCVATAIVTQRRGIKTTFSNSSPKTLACETFVYKALTVFNSSRKRLRPNSGWNADAQARLRLNSCRKTQLRLSCDAQLSCVKLSDCVLKRLRRKAASGAIAFEPRLERNHPFANVRRSLRRNHG